MSFLWHTFIFDPITNLLVFFVQIIPGASVGFAIIATTIVIRILLLPLSKKVLKSQIAQQKLQPQMDKIRETILDKQEQSRAMLELYRAEGVNPLAGIFLLLIQIPIIISLYFVFRNGLIIDDNILYSFIQIPEHVQHFFLGIDMRERSIILAIFAGLTQAASLQVLFHLQEKYKVAGAPENNLARAMRDMQKIMARILPIMVAGFAVFFPAAIPLYWCVSNLFTIAQEYFLRRGYAQKN